MNVFTAHLKHSGTVAAAAALSQLLLLIPNAVLAADDGIRLGGQVIFSTRASSQGVSADDRSQTVQRNLDNALVASQDRTPSSVKIVYVKGVPVITLGGYQVVTVSSDDAKNAGTTPAILAQRWAESLRGSLKDQASVSSYVAQLTGASASSPASGEGAAMTPVNSSLPPVNSGLPASAGLGSGVGPSGSLPAVGAPPYGPGGGGPGPYAPPGGALQSNTNYDQYGRMTGAPGGPPPYAGGTYAPGYGPYGTANGAYGGPPGGYPMQRGSVVYAQAGAVIPVTLKTSISTQAASPGDLIEAAVSGFGDAGAQIPPGTVLIGQIVQAKAGGFLGRSGMLEVKFNRLRTPEGMEVPLNAHIKGGIGKYTVGKDGEVHGEDWKTKVGQGLLRGVIGAGAGAALGTAVGAIAGAGMRRPWWQGGGSYAGNGAGTGAWSGAAIGGGAGVADSLLLRKGRDVTIKAGTSMEIQLDSPISIAGGGGPPPYPGQY